jgi:hypothetical protein
MESTGANQADKPRKRHQDVEEKIKRGAGKGDPRLKAEKI